MVAGAIGGVTDAVHELKASATLIATAVEQQGYATDEISSTIQQTAGGTEALRESMAGVQRKADGTRKTAEVVAEAARSLDNYAAELQEEVVGFIASVRAA